MSSINSAGNKIGRPKGPVSKTPLTLYLETEIVQKLRREAESENQTLSKIVYGALREYFLKKETDG